jgi:hypothetical protein
MHHDQAEGRAWGRLNDPHGCLVYYIEVENSIDSFMMATLARKQDMIDAGVEGVRVMAKENVNMTKEFINFLREHGA